MNVILSNERTLACKRLSLILTECGFCCVINVTSWSKRCAESHLSRVPGLQELNAKRRETRTTPLVDSAMQSEWQKDDSTAGVSLPGEQLMVQRAYHSRGDKHCGSATPPDVLSSALSGVTKHAHRESRHEGIHSYPTPQTQQIFHWQQACLKNWYFLSDLGHGG